MDTFVDTILHWSLSCTPADSFFLLFLSFFFICSPRVTETAGPSHTLCHLEDTSPFKEKDSELTNQCTVSAELHYQVNRKKGHSATFSSCLERLLLVPATGRRAKLIRLLDSSARVQALSPRSKDVRVKKMSPTRV